MNNTSKKILVVEDEKPIANILKLKLEEEGIEVIVANDGYEAIEALKEQTFNLCLLDLIMPEMDGFSVLRNLKDTGNKTPVIVSSNLSQPKDKERAEELGAIGYVIKSDTGIWQIIDQIKDIINKS